MRGLSPFWTCVTRPRSRSAPVRQLLSRTRPGLGAGAVPARAAEGLALLRAHRDRQAEGRGGQPAELDDPRELAAAQLLHGLAVDGEDGGHQLVVLRRRAQADPDGGAALADAAPRPLQRARRVGFGECVRTAGLVQEGVARGAVGLGARSRDRADDDLRVMLGVVQDAVDPGAGARLEVPSACLAGGVEDDADPRSGAEHVVERVHAEPHLRRLIGHERLDVGLEVCVHRQRRCARPPVELALGGA